jgi:hypothetical protein
VAQGGETRFKPGNPGGPGRGKGNRVILTEAFLRALREDFDKHGVASIEAMRVANPTDYVKIVSGLLAKQVTGEDGEAIPVSLAIRFVKPES